MGNKTGIAWTDSTWNPIRGCSRVSEGCRNCYAERVAARFSGPGQAYEGLARMRGTMPQWTGEVSFVESALELPLKWKKPRRIFVNSMSDLFHEKVTDEWLYRIFGVMALCPQHTFQILTKRPERMADFFKDGWDSVFYGYEDTPIYRRVESRGNCGNKEWYQEDADRVSAARTAIDGTPLPNVWLGVSVEDQATADERIPLLLHTPADLRWVSYEPALGPVDFRRYLPMRPYDETAEWHGLDWLVIGGESGPGARPFNLAWARQTVVQAREAGLIPVFVKQLGALPFAHNGDYPVLYRETSPVRYFPDYDGSGAFFSHNLIKDFAGANPKEWPYDLRVQEFPGA